jgi:hypothetical protein
MNINIKPKLDARVSYENQKSESKPRCNISAYPDEKNGGDRPTKYMLQPCLALAQGERPP